MTATAVERRHLPRSVLIWALSFAMVVVTGLIYFVHVRHVPPFLESTRLPWWALAALFFATERWVVHVHIRRDAHTFSLGEIPLVLGLFTTSGTGLLAAQLVGAAAALLHRQQSPIKLTFNLSHFALEAALAVVAFHALTGGSTELGPMVWTAALGASLLVMLLGVAAVMSAMRLSGETLDFSSVPSILTLGSIVTVANACLGLVTVIVLVVDPAATLLLLGPTGVVFFAYRGYTRERERHQSLNFLYRSARVGHGSTRLETLVLDLLPLLVEMYRAEFAEFILTDEENEEVFLGSLQAGGQVELVHRSGGPEETWMKIARHGPRLVEMPTGEEELDAYLGSRGISQALASPLSERGFTGVVVVANPLGEVRRFDSDDVTLLGTLANHVSSALSINRLVTDLQEQARQTQHRSLHDMLTDLPNRVLFRDRSEQALRAADRSSVNVAFLTLDINGFKQVNDALGSETGDMLLRRIGERLQNFTRRSDTVARTGGDEFAILLQPLDGVGGAQALMTKLTDALAVPFRVDESDLHVEFSAGVAVYPEHGTTYRTLLQRAEAAMYMAKQARQPFQIYAGGSADYSARRLDLSMGLYDAAHRDEIFLLYQPKFSTATRQIVGVEALARWQHPEFGVIMPEEFIAIAENSGQIRTLTLHVVDIALRQVTYWSQSKLHLPIAVNVSARNLFDDDFPAQVSGYLEKWAVSPSLLQLELTEDVLISDPERVIDVLKHFREREISLAIDDFGTGYSSLRYLSLLPVDEIKIDKSFILNMATSPQDEIIVRTTIDMARNLGLRVVAEGVNSKETFEMLVDAGCEIVQGFYMSVPLDAESIDQAMIDRDIEDGTTMRLP